MNWKKKKKLMCTEAWKVGFSQAFSLLMSTSLLGGEITKKKENIINRVMFVCKLVWSYADS